jgi:membrane associated rhomboid family serine protease
MVHLGLNVVLILACGQPCEQLLGSRRFLALGLLSLAANALAVRLTEGVNGASLVIWSWGPPLFLALAWARRRRRDVIDTPVYGQLKMLLDVMYAVVTPLMGVVPNLLDGRGTPFRACSWATAII